MSKKRKRNDDPFNGPIFDLFDKKIYLVDNYFSIPKSILKIGELESELTVANKLKHFKTHKPLPPVKAFKYHGNRIHVPKRKGYEFIKANNLEYVDIQESGESSKHLNDIQVTLDEENRNQVSAYNAIMDSLYQYGGASLSLPPGDGKTEVALKASETLKTKVAVLAHNKTVIEAWEARIPKRFPGAKIGYLMNKIYNYKDCDIVIISIPSLVRGKYSRDIMKQFGFVIIDEMHHISSETWSKSFNYLCAKYILGLSGTPYRKDGMEKIFEAYVGPVTFRTIRKYTTKVRVHLYKLEYDQPELIVDKKEDMNLPQILNNLATDTKRNASIVSHLENLAKTDRQTLFFSLRVSHLIILKEMIALYYPHIKTSLYIGNEKESDDFETVKKSQWIFSTIGKGSEALNLPTLSNVSILMPKLEEYQAISRIFREKETRIIPEIIAFYDPYFHWPKLFWTHVRFYQKEGYELVWHFHLEDPKKKFDNRPCPFKI
ncbi:MAG: DEAD/DEAH box helicase family protein [Candidatus Peregrinibacteria bacterium]|nr:DEAD/DEAH box helicase family protein [Candidatus Peregrinibacteria bacterium]